MQNIDESAGSELVNSRLGHRLLDAMRYKIHNIKNYAIWSKDHGEILNTRQLLIEGAQIHSTRDLEIASDWSTLKNINNRERQ